MSDEQITVGNISTPAGKPPGAAVELPVVQVLTGRGFVTGKSGSGKSNTASVVIEELLDCGYPVMIVDTDGEYYGLKEEYELLHAGADEECDIQVRPEHAEKLATLALEENVPIILDVSGYLDSDDADELLKETARHLFAKEKKLKKPFLLVVEEVHEYLPQKGGGGEVGNLLIKIGKRGRKHGLGLLGISQRPADVKKDFITQANWLVWHRLTWDNDTKVVGRVVDSEYSELVSELGDGEAFVQTDWTDADVRRVQFRRKRTFDAGATPGLDDFERPELKSVSDSLMDDLGEISDEQERRESELADLQQQLDKKRARINQLEQELEQARDVSNAARQLANAFTRGDFDTTGEHADESEQIEEFRETLEAKSERIEELETAVDEKRAKIAELEEALRGRDDRLDALQTDVGSLEAELDDAYDRIDRLEAENDRLREELVDARQSRLSDLSRRSESDVESTPDAAGTPSDSIVDADDSEFGLGTPDDSELIDADAAAGEAATESDAPNAAPDEDTDEFADAFEGNWPDPNDDGPALDADIDLPDPTEGFTPASDPESGSDGGRTENSPGHRNELDRTDAEFLSEEDREIPEDLETWPAHELVTFEPVRSKVDAAVRESHCNPDHSETVLEILSEEGPKRPDELEPRLDVRVQHVWTLLAELRGYEFVDRNVDGRYELDAEPMCELIRGEAAVSEQFQEFKKHAQQVD